MMTVKEHDDNWLASARAIQKLEITMNKIELDLDNINRTLKRNNAMNIVSELYHNGAMSKHTYIDFFKKMLSYEGIGWDEEDFKTEKEAQNV